MANTAQTVDFTNYSLQAGVNDDVWGTWLFDARDPNFPGENTILSLAKGLTALPEITSVQLTKDIQPNSTIEVDLTVDAPTFEPPSA